MPTEATAFGSSSLASSSSSSIANQNTKWGDAKVQPLIHGRNGATIYSTDKSSLGTQQMERYGNSEYFKLNLNPKGTTTPNIYSLRRSSLLR